MRRRLAETAAVLLSEAAEMGEAVTHGDSGDGRLVGCGDQELAPDRVEAPFPEPAGGTRPVVVPERPVKRAQRYLRGFRDPGDRPNEGAAD